MRKFSAKEQEFIKKLVENSRNTKDNYPINILDKFFLSHKFDYDGRNPSCPCIEVWAPNIQAVNIDTIVDISISLFEVAMLLKYLKDEGLIYTINYNANYSVIREWKANGVIPGYVKCSYRIDARTSDALIECINYAVFVGQTLKDLVDNDFMTIEERSLNEAKIQSKYSRWTLFVAILTLFITSVVSCFASDIKKFFLDTRTHTFELLNKHEKQHNPIEIKVNDVILKAKVYQDSFVISKELSILRNRADKTLSKK